MFTKEQINNYVAASYKIACKHGFHDEEKSNAHWMMLVVSEIGEMVEADRKNRRVKLKKDDLDNTLRFNDFAPTYELWVKGTLEEETADVCIRLFDFLGMKGIEPDVFDEKKDDWRIMFSKLSICEQCYELVQCITAIYNDTDVNEIAMYAGAALLFCFDFAEKHGFDLEYHIEQKMKYNESREKLHGKNY